MLAVARDARSHRLATRRGKARCSSARKPGDLPPAESPQALVERGWLMLPSRGISSKLLRVVASGLVVAAVLAVAGVAAALAAPTVTVRIEGESATLLPATTVTLGSPEPVSGCPANSVAAAINLAVGGNWDHGEEKGSPGDFTETLLGETHAFTHEGDTWAEWVDYKWGGGICSDLLSEGDEVLEIADH